MWNPRILLAMLGVAVLLAAQPAPAEVKVPALRPGEGFALTLGDGEVHAYGAAQKEAPMGSLAMLVWLRLEGAEWASQNIQFKCTGTAGPFTCWNTKGHGRVYLKTALQEDCDLAFLIWIAHAAVGWKADYGEAVARTRMVDVFAPFLGRRLPAGENLPPLTSVWVGDGDLLRTSPEAFLRWLMEPEQSEVVTFGQRFLAGNWVEVKELLGKEGWWFKTAPVSVPGDPTAAGTWVVGGRASALMVFFAPRCPSKKEALMRFKEIMGLT